MEHCEVEALAALDVGVEEFIVDGILAALLGDCAAEGRVVGVDVDVG